MQVAYRVDVDGAVTCVHDYKKARSRGGEHSPNEVVVRGPEGAGLGFPFFFLVEKIRTMMDARLAHLFKHRTSGCGNSPLYATWFTFNYSLTQHNDISTEHHHLG